MFERLIVVSNLVGVPSRHENAQADGLVVAMRAVLKRHPGIWFGWSGSVASGDVHSTRPYQHAGVSYVLTDLTQEDHDEYYNGFANRVLWPVLHYRLDRAEFSRRDLTGYLRVNHHFASELHKFLEPDDVVWVHDYHLLPLARMLRERGHRNRIGFFLHVPFPPPEILTALPNHERLIPSMADYDVLGFQTENDTDNFVRYLRSERCIQMLGHTFQVFGRHVRVDTFPIGIETAEFNRLAQRATHSPFVKGVLQSLSGQIMMISVDPVDYVKGLPMRMEAFERFLNTQTEWRGLVSYLQITPKSHSDIAEYLDVEHILGATAGRINATYGEAFWTPIRYVNRTYSRADLAGLYRAARVALVTPLRDGMNLGAKEFIAAQDLEDPGVLILSRFAGAAAELKAALLVNPYDPESVGAAIERALVMTVQERRQRHDALWQVISDNDVCEWGERFLTELAQESCAIDSIENTTRANDSTTELSLQ